MSGAEGSAADTSNVVLGLLNPACTRDFLFENWTRNPFLVDSRFSQVLFHSTLFTWTALTFRRQLYTISNIYWSYHHGLTGGIFKLSFTRREMLLTICLFPILDQCSLAIHSYEQYFECTEAAVASAALTVEADENTMFPKFRRLAAASSR